MKIIQLIAENVKRLTAIEITPGGDLVEIAGGNGAGKTSVLDSIWWALGGERVVQDDPIRHGETDAFVEVNLGELIVRRSWKQTPKGVRSTLKVEGANGVRFASPQRMLDDLLGALTFDPLEFSRMKPREQRDLLMELCGVGERLASLDVQRKELFDERTEVNREYLRLCGRAFREEITALEFDDIAEMQEVPLSDVVAELERAQAKTTENKSFQSSMEALNSEISEMNETLTNLVARRKSMIDSAVIYTAEFSQLQWPDIDAIKERLATVEEENRKVREAREYAENIEEISASQLQSNELSEDIKAVDEEKAATLSKAKFPIRGLEFSDDGVVFEGCLFEQCSSAEKLKVSTAIGMALNPKLRVLRITDGSLLDKSNLEFLAAMAKRRDFQIWIERVEAGTDAAILIEDGHVRETVQA